MALPTFVTALISVFDESKKKGAKVPSFFRSLFGTGEELRTETFNLDKVNSNREIAVQVVPGQGYTRNDYGKFDTQEFPIPEYNERMSVNAHDGFARRPGESPVNPVQSAQARILAKANESFPKMLQKIERAEELQAAQALINGKIPLSVPLGGTVEIDFSRDANLSITVPTIWSDAAAPIVSDIEGAAEALSVHGYSRAKLVVMSKDNFKNMQNNTGFKALTDNRRYELGSLVRPQLADNGGVYHGNYSFGSYDLEIWTYDGYYDLDGVLTRFLPVDRVLVIDPDGERYPVYGAVSMWQRTDALAAFGSTGLNIPVMAKQLPYVIADPNGSSNDIGVKTRPLYVPIDVNSVATLDTTP